MGKGLTAVTLAAFLGGCTSITVQSDSGAKTTHHFGLAVVSVPDERGAWLRSTGYGFALTRSGAAIGVVEETTFIAPTPATCSLVVIIEDAADAERIRGRLLPLLETIPEACFLKGGKS